MKNPFQEFKTLPYHHEERPLHGLIRNKEEVMARIHSGYLRLASREIKHMAWLIEHRRVVQAYGAALDEVRDLEFGHDDIEEFLSQLEAGEEIPFMMAGPAEIFLAALVNLCPEGRVVLNLHEYQRKFHFLGYMLPAGKTLVLQGDPGDFIGAGLAGGDLTVVGSAGDWCGAGMTSGRMMVSRDTGENTGEWMQGGELRVSGRIEGLGVNIHGGEIYQAGRRIFP